MTRFPGAAQHEAKRSGALQTRDPGSVPYQEQPGSRISGAPRRIGGKSFSKRHAARCTASGTRGRNVAGAVSLPEYPMPIKLAENFRAVFYAPFYATWALGFYAREGVEIELLSSSVPGDAVSALLDDRIDITWGGPMRVMKDRQPDSPLECFCEVVARDPFYLV